MLPSGAVATDADLLDAWRSGDQRAGRELFDRHYDGLYVFLRNKAGPNLDDLVQQTMTACVEGRDRIRGEFVHYLYGTARHLLYADYRRRAVRGDQEPDFGVTSACDLAPGVSSVVRAREEEQLLHDMLRRIGLDNQVVLELHYMQGFRGPEIATMLEIPEGTVRSRILRGIKQLRKLLDAHAVPVADARHARTTLDAWAADPLAAEPEPA